MPAYLILVSLALAAAAAEPTDSEWASVASKKMIAACDRGFAELDQNKPKRLVFDFFAKPLRIEGEGRAEQVVVEP